ncbi:MAG: orotate phosphoribosyltransferase [Chloroflexia bacterium]|nr:orotate phosphoribosyltransferase [Chloroflexia bacterium]
MAGIDLLERLREIGALKDGHYLLASGRHSGHYVEKFDLLRRPGATSEACLEIARRFEGDGIDVVVGPTTGGVLIAFETARLLGVEAGYAERSAEGDPGRVFRRGTRFGEGSRVLVVDDILTTGGSIRETLAALEILLVEVVGVAVLVDRSGGKVGFGIRLEALARLDIPTWEPAGCPLCAGGTPLVKPGTTAATAEP